MLHATLLTFIFDFTKINKPNIKLNNSININLTNPINNKVKNAILEEVEDDNNKRVHIKLHHIE